LKADAGNFRILHIAGHGIVNNINPMYSQIVLARADSSDDDGILEAWEIMNLNLKANLAVLSACDTARGRVRSGEGIIGLSWAFFVAGCPATVVSQWSVDAESTTDLMVEFHRNLRAGKNKVAALRQAELKLLKSRNYSHPFYWAPFIVMGDPR
jgi:CHAT domain-containing protein